jgi:hypothetical protein
LRPPYSTERRGTYCFSPWLLKLKKTGVPPDSPSRPPRGTSPPGWEPLVYSNKLIENDFFSRIWIQIAHSFLSRTTAWLCCFCSDHFWLIFPSFGISSTSGVYLLFYFLWRSIGSFYWCSPGNVFYWCSPWNVHA